MSDDVTELWTDEGLHAEICTDAGCRHPGAYVIEARGPFDQEIVLGFCTLCRAETARRELYLVRSA